MKLWLAITAIGLLLMSAGGCAKTSATPKSDRDAVSAAVQKHLSSLTTINMAAMDSSVSDITINGDQAQANVEFRLKQGGTTMQITYFLERHAGDWVVIRNSPAGGQFAHPPTDQVHSGMTPGNSPQSTSAVDEYLKGSAHDNRPGSSSGTNPAAAGKKSP
ncbi:MAG: hypothetical protein ACRD50_10865 [Candidatus Acidiferrales bacterium]